MRLRERISNHEQEQEKQKQIPLPVVPGENLARARQAAERFLAEGDDAINRALSVSSVDFLAANRQEGGQ